MLFLIRVGNLGVKYDSAFSDFILHHSLAALNSFQTRAKSQSQITTGKFRKHLSFHQGQKTNFLEPNTALSVLQVNHLTKCCLSVPLAGLQADGTHQQFYVLPSDLLALWTLGQSGYYSEADTGNTSPVNRSKCNTIHKQK